MLQKVLRALQFDSGAAFVITVFMIPKHVANLITNYFYTFVALNFSVIPAPRTAPYLKPLFCCFSGIGHRWVVKSKTNQIQLIVEEDAFFRSYWLDFAFPVSTIIHIVSDRLTEGMQKKDTMRGFETAEPIASDDPLADSREQIVDTKRDDVSKPAAELDSKGPAWDPTPSAPAPAMSIPPSAKLPSEAVQERSVRRSSLPNPEQRDFELETVEVSGGYEILAQNFRSFEVWTSKRIYGLDQHLRCVSVQNIGERKPDVRHPVVGARLMGGQTRDAGGAIRQVSTPWPKKQMSAVFSVGSGKKARIIETSAVTRMVVRFHVASVIDDAVPSAWPGSKSK